MTTEIKTETRLSTPNLVLLLLSKNVLYWRLEGASHHKRPYVMYSHEGELLGLLRCIAVQKLYRRPKELA